MLSHDTAGDRRRWAGEALSGRRDRARRADASPSRPARSSACSGRTAPASRRRSRSSPPSPGRTPAAHRSPDSTSSREPERVRRVIGTVGQRIAVDPEATGRENLDARGPAPRPRWPRRCASAPPSCSERFGLADAGESRRANLLRRDAAQARRGDGPRASAARPLPRRADDRPRPRGTRRAVGRDRAPHPRPMG